MATTEKKFRQSKMSELGTITPHELMPEYHFRSISFEDGSAGLFFGAKNGGEDEPVLVILDYLFEHGETVSYSARPNAQGTGTILFIDLDRAKVPAQLIKYKAAEEAKKTATAAAIPPPAATPPPASKPVEQPAKKTPPAGGITPPPSSEIPGEKIKPATEPPFKEQPPMPTTPPPTGVKGDGAKQEDDPYKGYGSRDGYFRAKDGYFERMEQKKELRDLKNDKEFTFRYFLTLANDTVLQTGKNLQPSAAMETAWTLAETLYNRFQALKYDENGQIITVRPEKSGEPA